MRFKKTATKGLVASDSTTSIATPRGITEDSFKLMLDKFKNQVFKDFEHSEPDGTCPVAEKHTEDYRTLAGFKKKKQRATHGMTKKEFHALVNTQ